MKDIALSALDRRSFLLSTLGLGLAFAMPGGLASAQGTRSGTLRYALLGLDTSDPHRHTGSIGVQQSFVEALTSIGPDGQVEPWLAESIDVSPDGLKYTFKLRRGVKFHNGDLLTAADVVANVDRVKSQIKSGWLVTAMKNVAKVEAPDDATVVLTMSEPYSPLLNLMSELWIVSPKSEGWAETVTKPIATGPFTFGDWQPNVSFTAPAFDQYWVPGLPHVEAVQFDLRDASNYSLALLAGDLHIAGLAVEEVDQVNNSGTATVKYLKDTSWYSIAFNNRKPRAPFDNVKVRQAIAYAVDKTAFMEFATGKSAVVTNQMAAPGNFYFDQAMHDADAFKARDLEKAKALLAEAGVNPAEHKIRFVSWQNDYNQVIVQAVRELGFEVDHAALDDLGAQNRLGGDDWDMNAMSSGPRADIYLRYVRLMSDGPNPVLWGNIQDKELDALVAAAVKEPDAAKRRETYLKAMQLISDKMYFVVLGHAAARVGVRNEVSGYDPGFTYACSWATGGVAHLTMTA